MKTQVETIGRLKCRLVGHLPAGERPDLVVVLSHGYGASGSDLVPIGHELLDQYPDLDSHVQFVFPEAPLPLDDQGIPGGRAWWPIDLMRLQVAAATGQFRQLQRDRSDGMVQSRNLLIETLQVLSERWGLRLSQFVIGGFSQGAMLSVDTSLALPENVAGVLAMSGSLLNEAEWLERAPQHPGLRVVQSHGTADPLLPFDAAENLRDLLASAGALVEFIPFEGGHQIPFEVFDRIGAFLSSLVAAR